MRPGLIASLLRLLLALALVSSGMTGATAAIADAGQAQPCVGEMADGDCPNDCCGDECPPRDCSGFAMAAIAAVTARGTVDLTLEARTSAPATPWPSVAVAPLLRPPSA